MRFHSAKDLYVRCCPCASLLWTEYLCPPPPNQNSYVEALIPNVKDFGGGVFGRYLGYKDGTLIYRINALIKR